MTASPALRRIILVEDNPGDARLVQLALAEAIRTPLAVEHVTRLDAALDLLGGPAPDALLLDLSLPDSTGLDTVTRVRRAAPHVPIIVLTGREDEAFADEVIRSGAQDYLVKGQVEGTSVSRAIRYAVERHRVLEELDRVRQEQVELRDRFLSHVSHELRGPLAAVCQFVSNVKEGALGPVSERQSDHLDRALGNARQLKSMIGELLEVSRARSQQLQIAPERMEIGATAAEALAAVRAQAGERGIALELELEADLPAVFADPRRVRQVLDDLLENGIRFTGSGGRVRLEARAPGGEPGYVRVTVRDTGCGIPLELLTRVFDPLVQVQEHRDDGRRGLGLGLYLCRELVLRQGGRIWAENEPEAGIAFHFTLPEWAGALAMKED